MAMIFVFVGEKTNKGGKINEHVLHKQSARTAK